MSVKLIIIYNIMSVYCTIIGRSPFSCHSIYFVILYISGQNIESNSTLMIFINEDSGNPSADLQLSSACRSQNRSRTKIKLSVHTCNYFFIPVIYVCVCVCEHSSRSTNFRREKRMKSEVFS